jgi:hypothetical protein
MRWKGLVETSGAGAAGVSFGTAGEEASDDCDIILK